MNKHTTSRIYRVQFSSWEVVTDFTDAATVPEFGGMLSQKNSISFLHVTSYFLTPNDYPWII